MRSALLSFAFLATAAAATYAASCHCGAPSTSSPLPLGEGQGEGSKGAPSAETVPSLGASAAEKVPPLGARGGEGELRSRRSALTSTVTTDADFLTSNRGYGIVEDTSVSAGIIRRTLGLPNFGLANANPTVTGWQTTTSFTTARLQHSSVVHGGYLYVLGGCTDAATCTGVRNDVQYARVNADGTVGTWNTALSFATARAGHTSVVHNGYVYVVGGVDVASTRLDNIQYAKLNADGTVGAWSSITATAVRRSAHSSVVHNGYLYVIGGFDGTLRNDVQFAPIDGSGAVGAWQATSSFSTGRYYPACAVHDGHLYLTGGTNGSARYADIQYARINADGTLGSWQSSVSTLPSARNSHQVLGYGDRLYVLGGASVGGVVNDVQFAPITAAGTLGSWTQSTAFSTVRYGHASVIENGFLYVLGGQNGTSLNDVQFAPLRPDGHVGTTWVKAADLPSSGRVLFTSVVHDGFLYVTGGFTSGYSNDVQFAPVLADGTLGPWTATRPFATPRAGHASVIHNGFIYVLGGDKAQYQHLNDVQFAKINADGTLGDWVATTSFATTRLNPASAVHGGRLYVMGGITGTSTILSDVQYSTINPDGTLGNWATTTALPTARYQHGVQVSKGQIYSIASYGGANYVDFAQLNGDGSLGSWISTTAFSTARAGFRTAVLNDFLYVFGGEKASGGFDDVQVAQINGDGTVGAWSATTSFPTGRCGHSSVVHNGHLYIIGGGQNGNCTAHVLDVQFAPINANGTVGEWKETTGLSPARTTHSLAVAKEHVYVMGGHDGSNYLADVDYANIRADGTLGNWSQGSDLPTVVNGLTSFATTDSVCKIGGHTVGSDLVGDVRCSDVNADGSMGSWVATTDLPTLRSDQSTEVYNGFLYVLGGQVPVNQYFTTDVIFAPILSSGSVGTWAATSGFQTARTDHRSFVYGGRMYVVGGEVAYGHVTTDSVEMAQFDSNGEVGTWSTTTALPVSKSFFGMAGYNGFAYAIGGYRGSALKDIVRTTVRSNGALEDWTQMPDFVSSISGASSIGHRGFLYVVGGSDGSNAKGNVYFAPVTAYRDRYGV